MTDGDTTIHTGGGASAEDVQTGRDFVGRDQFNFLVALDWEKLREFLSKSQVSETPFQRWRAFDWPKAEQAYLDKIIRLYDRVRILGSSADVSLGEIFTGVYILDRPTARQRYDIDELRKQGADRVDFQRQPGRRIHGLDLVKTNQNLFILGKPGAGKTTLLKYITVQAAHKQLPRIPIFVSLNYWADSRWGKGDQAALLPFLVEQFEICDFPDAELFIDYLLKEGRALVLFDGLDEVKQEQNQRRRLTRLLQEFARKYDKSQHLITCRIAASDYAFAGFADVEVADFTPDQVREYARKWFGEQEKKFETFTTELAKPEHRGLAELCNTPLLLSLLCLTFDNNMRFPPSRAELYEDALETLLRKWDTSRAIQRDEVYRELSNKRKLQLLMRIAVPTFEKGELFFRQRDLERWIVEYLVTLPGAPPADALDGTTLLKAMEAQHGILVERAQGIYSFSHLTFQEYLTARYLAENHGRGVTGNLIRNHLTDRRWREVFLLTASLLDNADEYIAAMHLASDHTIVDTPAVGQLLVWAHSRTHGIDAPVGQRLSVQVAYIFLALAFAVALDRSLAIALDRALAFAVALARALTLAPALERAISLARSLTLALDRSLALARDLAHERESVLSLSLSRATTSLVGFDYGLYYAWAHASIFANKQLAQEWRTGMQQFRSLVNGVVALANEAGMINLAQQLTALSCPTPGASKQGWQQYASALFAMLRDERDPGRKWNLHHADVNKLNNYFYANELLVQCLKVAVVTDRRAVLNGLLLPPQVQV